MIRKLDTITVERYMCPYCFEVHERDASALLCAEECYQDRLADKADDDRKENKLRGLYSDE